MALTGTGTIIRTTAMLGSGTSNKAKNKMETALELGLCMNGTCVNIITGTRPMKRTGAETGILINSRNMICTSTQS